MPPKKTQPKLLDLQQTPKAGGYIRVSTNEQEDDSLSLDRQKSAVEAAGATVIFKDVDPGSKDDRKALQELMQRVHAGEIDEVIVSRIDRLTRSLRQLLDLISEFETLDLLQIRLRR